MGSQSLPFLLGLLTYEDSFLGARLRLLRHKELQYPTCRRRAVLGFDALGPLATPVIPELNAVLQRGPLHGGKEAATALAAVGTEGWTILTQTIKSISEASRSSMWALGNRRAAVPGTVPALKAVVTSHDGGDASIAAWALGAIGEDPDTVIPLLIAGLHAPDHRLRVGCAAGLGEFGPRAQSAVPALRLAVEGDDQQLADIAALSLGRITLAGTPDVSAGRPAKRRAESQRASEEPKTMESDEP